MRSSYCSARWPTGKVAVSVAGSAAQPRGRAGLPQITFRGLRQSFVAMLVVARCNVREVSEWAGHNNVAFTLTRYGELLEDGSDWVISAAARVERG
jgi:integrase